MIYAFVAALVLASCVSKPLYPTANADERKWLQDYRDGKMSWSDYRQHLNAEKGP